MQKQFLEQICDGCLLEEFNARSSPISFWSDDSINDTTGEKHLILDSEVTIEIDTHSNDNLLTSIRGIVVEENEIGRSEDTFAEQNRRFDCYSRDTRSCSSSFQNKASARHQIRSSIDSTTTTNDADDEGSLYLHPSPGSSSVSVDVPQLVDNHCLRRDQSRIGLDLSREDFELELRTFKSQKDEVEEACNTSIETMKGENILSLQLSSWIRKGRTNSSLKIKSAKNIMKNFRSVLTRSSPKKLTFGTTREGEAIGDESEDGGQRIEKDGRLKETHAVHSPITLRAVVEDDSEPPGINSSIENADTIGRDTVVIIQEDENAPGDEEESDEDLAPTWEEHLFHDMKRRSKRKAYQKRVMALECDGNDQNQDYSSTTRAQLHKTSLVKVQSAVGQSIDCNSRVFHVSQSNALPTTNNTIYEGQCSNSYTRLPSAVSELQSDRSANDSCSFPIGAGERLDRILSSDEFDQSSDEKQWVWECVPKSSPPLRSRSSSVASRDRRPADDIPSHHGIPMSYSDCTRHESPYAPLDDSSQRAASVSPGLNNCNLNCYQSSGTFETDGRDEGILSIHPLTTGLVHGLSIKRYNKKDDEDAPVM